MKIKIENRSVSNIYGLGCLIAEGVGPSFGAQASLPPLQLFHPPPSDYLREIVVWFDRGSEWFSQCLQIIL